MSARKRTRPLSSSTRSIVARRNAAVAAAFRREARADAARAAARRPAGLRPGDVTVTDEAPDGYAIDLPFGWVMPGGAHEILEASRGRALARLAEAVPCDCAGRCRQGASRP